MKKNKLFAVLVSILMFATVFMSGCAFFKGANKLELTEMPKSTYELKGEDWTASQESLTAAGFSFAIKLTKDDGVTTYVFGKEKADGEVELTYNNGFYAEVNGVSAKVFELVDFNLSKAGKFTATIKGEGAICTFVYTVKTTGKNDGFAAGSGVEGDPYIIETAEQFLKLDSIENANFFGDTVKYFQLNADIDLNGKNGKAFTSFDNDKLNTLIKRVHNINLDGNGHKLYNFAQDLNCVIGDTTSGTAVFSNLDFYLDGQNMAFLYITAKGTTVTFNSVNAKGAKTNASGNTGVYTVYSRGVLDFVGCKNYCSVASTDTYVAGFVGYPLNNVTFTRCTNYADIAAEKAGAFICNAARCGKATFVDCDNEGRLISVADSNMCFAVSAPDSLLIKDSKLSSSFGSNGGELIVDNVTLANMKNRDNMVVMDIESVYSQYLETCAFNADTHELEIKLVSGKESKVTKIEVVANYLPSYYSAKQSGNHGTSRQYLRETISNITGDVMKTVNVLKYSVKAVDSLADGVKAATNDNTEWSVVDGSYVIAVDQMTGEDYMLIKGWNNGEITHYTAGEKVADLTYTVFIFEGDKLVAGKVIKA